MSLLPWMTRIGGLDLFGIGDGRTLLVCLGLFLWRTALQPLPGMQHASVDGEDGREAQNEAEDAGEVEVSSGEYGF
jgi:hypothetical protein